MRVIVTGADDHPAAAVSDVFELQAQNLAGTKTALQHQPHHRPVPPAAQRPKQRLDLLVGERSRETHRLSDGQRAPLGLLPAGSSHVGAMPISDPAPGWVGATLDWMAPLEHL